MKKRIIAFALSFAALFSSLTAHAAGEMPDMTSYQYSYWMDAVAAPEAYALTGVINSTSLGLPLAGVIDICADKASNIYILDSAGNKLIKLDRDYKVTAVLESFTFEEKEETLNAPEGLFVAANGDIYIADTGNARVAVFDKDFVCTALIADPTKTALLDYTYQPAKVCADKDGHVYVISKNETQGVLQFSARGEFIGYLGATRVVPSLTEIFYRTFATRAQLKNMLRSIPTEYNNLDIDSDGFIYGTVSSLNPYTIMSDINSGGSTAAPVRKINANGDDILVRNGGYPPVGELIFNVLYGAQSNYDGPSTLVDVATRENGIYSLLDSNRGRVFTYDNTGNLLYIFGSRGSGAGQFEAPAAITYQGENIIVADQKRGELQVFSPTPYANNILTAIGHYQAGEYEKEQEMWQKVLYEYPGSDMAYIGIGKSYYNRKQYKTAMDYFKKGHDRYYYSKAFKHYRNEVGRKYTPWALLAAVILIAAVLIYKLVLKKRFLQNRKPKIPPPAGSVKDKLQKLYSGFKYGFYIVFHPFDGFWDVKYEKRGSTASATLILVLCVIMNIITNRCTPYLFNFTNFSQTNILLNSTLSIIAPVALWCAANWCLTTLMDGKGSAKDIYIFTCYSLFPRLILYPVLLVASFAMSAEEAAFYSLLLLVAQVWVGFLIFCGTLVTHHYSAFKTVMCIILSIVGIAIIVFIGLLGVTLAQQVIEFIKTLWLEITLRM